MSLHFAFTSLYAIATKRPINIDSNSEKVDTGVGVDEVIFIKLFENLQRGTSVHHLDGVSFSG